MDLKKILIGTTAAVALSAGASAQASDYYISVFGGFSTLDSGFDVGASGSSQNQILDWNFGKYNAISQPTDTINFSSVTGTPTWFTFVGGKPTGPHYFNTKYIGLSMSITTNQHTAGAWEGGFDSGFVVGAAIGTSLGGNWRGELEVAYRSHDVDDTVRLRGLAGYGLNMERNLILRQGTLEINGDLIAAAEAKYTGTGTSPSELAHQSVTAPIDTRVSVTGDASTWSFMANIWYDFDGFDKITPFVGAGIGFAQMSFNHALSWSTAISTYQLSSISKYLPSGTAYTKVGSLTGTNILGTSSFTFGGPGTRVFNLSYSVDSDDWAMAYQFGAGVSYAVGNGMELSAQYRYFGTGEFDFGPQAAFDAESHNFLIGLRIPLQ